MTLEGDIFFLIKGRKEESCSNTQASFYLLARTRIFLKHFRSLPGIGEGAGTSLGTFSVLAYPSLESSSSHLLIRGKELFCALVKGSQGVNFNSTETRSECEFTWRRQAGWCKTCSRYGSSSTEIAEKTAGSPGPLQTSGELCGSSTHCCPGS